MALRVQVPGLRLRAEPGTDAEVLATLSAGATVAATGDPVSRDGLTWYPVRWSSLSGWVSSGEADDWLALVGNGRIAFGSIDCEGRREQCTATANADGSDATVILPDFMARPIWSPTGEQIALEYHDPGNSTAHLVVANPLGDMPDEVGPGVSAVWSPDGSRLAWTDDQRLLWMREGSGEPIGLPAPEHGAAGAMAWSPDGTRIAFVGIHCPGCTGPIMGDPPLSVFVLALGADAPTRVADGYPGDLRWSLDGSTLSFSDYDLGTGTSERLVIDMSSGAVSPAVAVDGLTPDAILSPDGTQLVDVTDEGIVVANADGTDRRVIVSGAPDANPMAAGPRWSPDGRWILYQKVWVTGDAIEAWIVPADGSSEPARVAELGYDAAWQPVLTPLP